jgi:hypothetical protein
MEMSIIEKLEEYKDSESVDFLESALDNLKSQETGRQHTMESLSNTSIYLKSARSGLLGALAHSNRVEAILIQQGLESLHKTRNLVDSIRSAMEASE